MNRFMKKFKAVYCNASFIFAIAVLMVTISLCIFYPDSVNASQSPSPSGDISTNDVTNDLDDVKSLDSGDKDLADATSDSTNGIKIYYNNESGSLSTPVRMFLVLTVLSLAPSILINPAHWVNACGPSLFTFLIWALEVKSPFSSL